MHRYSTACVIGFSRVSVIGVKPFPTVQLEDGTIMSVPESELPVELPPIDEYKPTPDGKRPLRVLRMIG